MKKVSYKIGGMLLGACALLWASCAGPSGGGSGGSSSKSGVEGLEGTVWLYNSSDSSTEKPEKPAPDAGSGEGGGNSDIGGGGSGYPDAGGGGSGYPDAGGGEGSYPDAGGGSTPGEGSGEGSAPDSGSSSTEETHDFVYLYFDNDGYAYYGDVSWTDTVSGGEIVTPGTKYYTPKFAGKYEKDQNENDKVTFHFTHEKAPNDASHIWTNVPKKETSGYGPAATSKVTNTIDRTGSSASEVAEHGLFGHQSISVSHSSSELVFTNHYQDEGYSAKQWWNWDSDSYNLDTAQMCINATGDKFTDAKLGASVFVGSDATAEYVAFEDNKIASTGTLRSNKAEIFGADYKDSYSIDTTTVCDAFYGEYDSKIFEISVNNYGNVSNATEKYSVTGSGDTIELTNIKSKKVLKKIPSAESDNSNGLGNGYGNDYGNSETTVSYKNKIFATTEEGKTFANNEDKKDNGGNSYWNRAYGDEKKLSKYVKNYPDFYVEGWAGAKPTYQPDLDWCFQESNFIGYTSGKPEIEFKLIELYDEQQRETKVFYGIENLVNGKIYGIDKLLPGAFRVKDQSKKYTWIEVTKNSKANGGKDIVDFTLDGKKYTLSFDCSPYANTTITKNYDAQLLSIYAVPAKNPGLSQPVYADINQKDKTITFNFPSGFDKTNVVFNYKVSNHDVVSEYGTVTTTASIVGYSNSPDAATAADFYELKKLRAFKVLYPENSSDEHMRWTTNTLANPNDIVYPTRYDECLKIVEETTGKSFGLGVTKFLSSVQNVNGKAMYDKYTLATPDNCVMSYEGYTWLKNVYNAIVDTSKDFKVSDWIDKQPNMYWVDPTPAGRSITFGDAGAFGNNSGLGYDLTKMKKINVYTKIDNTPFNNIYTLTVN